MSKPIVIFITTPNNQEAEAITRILLEEKLVACSNIIPGIQSIFYWKEKLCKEDEVLLILKSFQSLLHKIIKRVKILHSYEVPEIIAMPIVGGDEKYISWMKNSTI